MAELDQQVHAAVGQLQRVSELEAQGVSEANILGADRDVFTTQSAVASS